MMHDLIISFQLSVFVSEIACVLVCVSVYVTVCVRV